MANLSLFDPDYERRANADTMAEEAAIQVDAAMAKLPPAEQDAAIWHFVDGLSTAVIKERTGIPEACLYCGATLIDRSRTCAACAARHRCTVDASAWTPTLGGTRSCSFSSTRLTGGGREPYAAKRPLPRREVAPDRLSRSSLPRLRGQDICSRAR